MQRPNIGAGEVRRTHECDGGTAKRPLVAVVEAFPHIMSAKRKKEEKKSHNSTAAKRTDGVLACVGFLPS
jgi:hypothetical protein